MFGMIEGVLPQPIDGFAWVQVPAGAALTCRAMPPFARHFFTTRAWRVGSPDGRGDEGWREVADEAGVDIHDLARMHQVHGAAVVHATKSAGRDRPTADIAITAEEGVALSVQAADCVPLLLADPRRRVVAAAHAGWRGLAVRVPQVAVDTLVREFGSRPADLIAALGPSIGACCYEVGIDVRDAFARAGFGESAIARWFFDAPRPTAANPSLPTLSPTRRADHWFLDCWAVARDQLSEAGVTEVHGAGLCTASHPDVLCSYRRDGKGAGRIAGVIAIA
jgi:purine-nucleoside/S-methyl-5'-thioadenosine phosphorylase / adenosine deaminase